MTDLLECGHPESPHSSITRGYGIDSAGNRHCYDCCAEQDRADMIKTGRATLYLVERDVEVPLQNADYYGLTERTATIKKYFITNWPGSLEFEPYRVRTSKHGGGFGSQRTDAWFTGPDGKKWHAINRGDMDVARCRRLKA